MNSIAIVLVALVAIVWLAFLVANGLRGRSRSEVGANMELFKSDDELESTRLDRVLGVSVILSAFLAISLPVYWLGEINRQESFVEEFSEVAIERGEHHVDEFKCASCHGGGLDGGGAGYIDARSGVSVNWIAPAINDIFYRYDRDEVKFWLVYGRANSPMPAWGEAGNGPMNDAQIEEVLDYLESIQVTQEEAVARSTGLIDAAVTSFGGADATVLGAIEAQQDLIAFYGTAEESYGTVKVIVDAARQILDPPAEGDANGDGFDDVEQWEATYAIDTDEDGLADKAEDELSQLFTFAEESGYSGFVGFSRSYDARNPSTNGFDGDNRDARDILGQMEQQLTTLEVAVENLDRLSTQADAGLEFLQAAADTKNYEFDMQAIADSTFGGNVDDATRAVAVYQAMCARCHTSGYSEGPAFTQEVGAGGLGPALWDGRPNIQFADAEDMKDFISGGSQIGVGYGINGIGRGYMPGFGTTLAEDDLDLVIQYLRGEVLR